jgi:putative DNA primase/helicase
MCGVGFVFAVDDPYCGIDLDECVENGVIAPWAKAIIDQLGGYAETSPSGKGVKVWVRASLGDRPGGHWYKPHEVECYDRGRYFTVTGSALPGSKEIIPEAQVVVDAIYAEFEAARKIQNNPKGRGSANGHTHSAGFGGPVDVAQIIRLASSASNGGKFAALWKGDVSGYTSASEADLALCSMVAFFVGPDAGAIDAVVRESGLKREKWDRDDYLPRTIARALKGRTEFYRPQRPSTNGSNGRMARRAAHVAAVRSTEAGDPVAGSRPCTDLGNAERLVERFGSGLRYGLGKWFVWDQRRWREDDTGAVMRCAAKTARGILREAEKCKDSGQSKALAEWAVESESSQRLLAMVKVASTQDKIVIRADELDADPWLFNVQNGTIDLRTGALRPHDQDDLITKLAPVRFDPDATCPMFMAFVDRIFAGRADLIAFVQRWFGYSLTGIIDEQLLPVFHGVGANGKSVLVDSILAIMGDFGGLAPPYLLVESRGQREHPTEIADLRGLRFVPASETEEGAVLKLQLVKRLTGDRTLKGRFMRADYFEFPRTHKLLLVTNNKPRVREDSEAVWRRLRLIPFDVVIPAKERDPKLIDKLRAEWPGILAWLVRGCIDWQRHGLGDPAAVTEATRAYRKSEDVIGRFLEEQCVMERPGTAFTLFVPWALLWADYVKWTEETGESPVSAWELQTTLDKIGYPTNTDQYAGKKVKGRPGIGLRDHRAEEAIPR